MAFTSADKLAIERAMVTLAVDGIAAVTVGGQSVTVKSMSELESLLKLVNADLVSTTRPGQGVRIQKIRPYYE
jgi:hypothetical protein